MHPARPLGGRQRGGVAIRWAVERIQKPLRDIGFRLAEIDVEHIGRNVAGDGQQRAFDTLHLNAGKAVELHREVAQVQRAIARGVGGLARAQEVGRQPQKFALHDQLRAGRRIGAGGVRQVEERQVQGDLIRGLRDPPRAGGSGRGEQKQGAGDRPEKMTRDFFACGRRVFHTVEKSFPHCGKMAREFSTLWKISGCFFHGVENCRHSRGAAQRPSRHGLVSGAVWGQWPGGCS